MKRTDVRLALFFKDFASWCRTSCVGLHVAGFATRKVLERHGFETETYPVRHNIDVVNAIDKYNETHRKHLTHVVISAPWLSVHDLKSLLYGFPEIQFVVLSHSNVGFLQADPRGVHLLREYHKLSQCFTNFKVGGNSKKFVEWMEKVYGEEVVLLPNLYPDDDPVLQCPWSLPEPLKTGSWPLKIGVFGATRAEKNFMTAAAAVVAIQAELNTPVELHMSAGGEGEIGTTSAAIDQMCTDKVVVIRHPWVYWDKFISIVSSMHLLIQVSYTESFNMITADGISVGVPSVVSSAIYWAPPSWMADPDSALDVADVGLRLLTDCEDRAEGLEYLRAHNENSLEYWEEFLLGEKEKTWWKIW
jgi:hypothetical protein